MLLSANTHTLTHTRGVLKNRHFAGRWSKCDFTCHLKHAASSRCRSGVLQSESLTVLAGNQTLPGGLYRQWQANPHTHTQHFKRYTPSEEHITGLLNLGQPGSGDRADLYHTHITTLKAQVKGNTRHLSDVFLSQL